MVRFSFTQCTNLHYYKDINIITHTYLHHYANACITSYNRNDRRTL